MRKTVMFSVSLACAFSCNAIAVTEGRAQNEFKVTLLGTGSPQPRPTRMGPSTLVEAGDQRLLFAAGRGVPVRLGQLGVPLGALDVLFITHYHSDTFQASQMFG